ncbi:TVP38/TMEM64 family protein [Ahrensia sp. 13_GOM-1096m]|uniref:TVP38/TMEM64 family protein n=1 Tax=Ahrensia sp. 13_GOM-1096m TaxID=1380380 RepID=UPI000A5A596B|nr:VTT domain-containing protein [Ahrensia sp. 13_GOM-1096m]
MVSADGFADQELEFMVPEKSSKMIWLKVTITLIAITILGYLWASGLIGSLFNSVNSNNIAAWFERAGNWGPLIIIGFMVAAVVASPIPTAPIAIAAGAAYGQTVGTIYVIIGAFIGAMIAFYLSKWLGRNAIQKWFGEKADKGLLGSQNALTATIFFSRLLPFVSFDMISYVAGLSVIKTWRFALATLIGVIPTAFLMAHLGEMAIDGDTDIAMWFSALLGIAVAIPLLLLVYRKIRPAIA